MKSYHQHCGLARALDQVGERWTLLIVRDLLLGPLRYSDLHRRLKGITTNLLAKRLKALEEEGLIERRPLDHGVTAYALTEAGLALEPVILELGRWGQRYMAAGPGPGDRADPRWAMCAVKRRYRPSPDFRVELQVDADHFALRSAAGKLSIQAGPCFEPEATLRGPLRPVYALIHGMLPLDKAVAGGAVTIVQGEQLPAAFVEGFGIRLGAAGSISP